MSRVSLEICGQQEDYLGHVFFVPTRVVNSDERQTFEGSPEQLKFVNLGALSRGCLYASFVYSRADQHLTGVEVPYVQILCVPRDVGLVEWDFIVAVVSLFVVPLSDLLGQRAHDLDAELRVRVDRFQVVHDGVVERHLKLVRVLALSTGVREPAREGRTRPVAHVDALERHHVSVVI